jgi:integrase
MTDLTSKTKRRKLPARSAPHYARIAAGVSLGWRWRGNWPARWMAKIRLADGSRHEVSLGPADDEWPGGMTYDEASDAARKAADAPRVVGDLTVGDALDDWRDSKASQTSSPKAAATYASEVKTLKAALGSIRLDDLTAGHLEKWKRNRVQAAADKRRAMASTNRRLATLKAALNRAVSGQPGPFPWASVAKFDKEQSFHARIRILTANEETAILGAARSDLARFIHFLLRTGCRPGEAAAVQIRGITFGSDGGGWVTTTGKTGPRRFRIDPGFARTVRAWIATREGGPLLIRDDGDDWSDARHIKLWRRTCRDAGIADATAYACRDTFISRALRGGASIAAVAQHCGTSPDQIMKSYFSELPQEADQWLANV